MTIRRASQQLAYDENGEPYWQMDDDPEGSYVLYSDHLGEMENSWEEAYAQGYNRGRVDGESRSCALSYRYGYENAVKEAQSIVNSWVDNPSLTDDDLMNSIDALLTTHNPNMSSGNEK